MAEAAAESNDLPICSICLGSYKTPRMLPCLHSFCEICISEYILSTVTQPGQNAFNCPLCKFVVVTVDSDTDKSKWVSYLPLTPFPDNSTIIGENKQQFCHPCQRSENIIEACTWCCECNEALCQSCKEFHSRLKMTLTHKTVSIKNMEGICNETVSLLQTNNVFCLIHKDKRTEMYCADHDEIICIKCVLSNHGKCLNIQDINSIDEQLEGNLTRLESDMNGIQSVVKTLVEEKTEKKISVQSTVSLAESEALRIVTELKMKLDDFYIEFLKKAGIQQDELQSELDQALKELGGYDTALSKLMQNMNDIRVLGSKVQVFLTTRYINLETTKIIESLKSLLKKDEFSVEASFKNVLKVFEDIQDLGVLTVSRYKNNHEDVNKLIFKIEEPEFSSIALKFHSRLQFPEPKYKEVRSCIPLNEDLCVVLFTNTLALVNTPLEKVIDSVPLTETSKRLCIDPDSKTIYGSCGKMCFSCKIRNGMIENYQCFKCYSGEVRGLDACNGNIFSVTSKNLVLRSIENLEIAETFIKTDSHNQCIDIAIDKSAKRFAIIKRSGKTSVQFGSMQERSLRECSENHTSYTFQKIAFGPYGLLFVAEMPSSIHVISKDEKKMKILLSNLSWINDISVDCENSKLYVSEGKCLKIYDIIYS